MSSARPEILYFLLVHFAITLPPYLLASAVIRRSTVPQCILREPSTESMPTVWHYLGSSQEGAVRDERCRGSTRTKAAPKIAFQISQFSFLFLCQRCNRYVEYVRYRYGVNSRQKGVATQLNRSYAPVHSRRELFPERISNRVRDRE